MRVLANILWHIPFMGFITAFISFLFGSLFVLTVVASPIGFGLIQHSKFLLNPFSSNMVKKSSLNANQNKAWKVYGTIIRVLYFPFGLLLAVLTVFQIAGLFLTIIGIPMAVILAKSLSTYFNPVNKKCVPRAVAVEIDRRKAKADIEKHFA